MGKIIPFNLDDETIRNRLAEEFGEERNESEREVTIEVMPGESMPEGYPDYRPLLQRDGLFLYSWAVWVEKGLIVVNWFRSAGQMRKLASWYCNEQELATITPTRRGDNCKGDAWPRTWEGGSEGTPDYAVYAAPRDIQCYDRPAYLVKLREAGVTVNLDYEFTIAEQKGKVMELPRPIPVMERFLNLVNHVVSHPQTTIEQLEDFIGAIHADGTVDRWKRESRTKGRAETGTYHMSDRRNYGHTRPQ